MLVALLVLGTVPSGFELVEKIVHAVAHGDLGGESNCDRECNENEHDCTPIQHRCGCCGSQAATPVEVATLFSSSTVSQPASVALTEASLVGCGAPEPNHRPPIAT